MTHLDVYILLNLDTKTVDSPKISDNSKPLDASFISKSLGLYMV